MRYKLKAYTIWEFGQRVDGQGRPHQEDSLYPRHGEATDDDRLFMVCDGMGGHDAGEVASCTVCEAMSKNILKNTEPEGEFLESDFQEALDAAFMALDEKDTGAEKKMGTTMTLLKFHNRGCFIAHLGDSRVYHFRPGDTQEQTKILFQTEDHSLVNSLLRIGELKPEDVATFPKKNVITKAMQPHMERQPKASIKQITDIEAGDYFYLCSDGMLEHMTNDNLCYYFSGDIKSNEDRVKKLIDATKECRDNHTAIIVHVVEVYEEGEELMPELESVDVAEKSMDVALRQKKQARPKAKKTKKGNWGLIITIVLLVLLVVVVVLALKFVI